jgi:hypothetical protein
LAEVGSVGFFGSFIVARGLRRGLYFLRLSVFQSDEGICFSAPAVCSG